MRPLTGAPRLLNPRLPCDQMRLGGVVDRLLNGGKNRRAAQAFFLFVAPFSPRPEDDGGVIISNQPADVVVPLMIDWIEKYAPGRITVNKLN